MSNLRLFVGITGTVVALFAGGCTLLCLGNGAGPIPLVIGGIPAALGAGVAYWAFRKSSADQDGSA